jgi:hypothetical protein
MWKHSPSIFLDQPEQHLEQYYEDDCAKDRPDYAPYHTGSLAEKEIKGKVKIDENEARVEREIRVEFGN